MDVQAIWIKVLGEGPVDRRALLELGIGAGVGAVMGIGGAIMMAMWGIY